LVRRDDEMPSTGEPVRNYTDVIADGDAPEDRSPPVVSTMRQVGSVVTHRRVPGNYGCEQVLSEPRLQ
jgi:hypothetical protein